MDSPNQSNSNCRQPTVFIFMGVAGCGKSTAAADFLSHLASSHSTTSAPLIEADDFHSPENKAKMSAGTPLTDADRWPWLAALGAAIAQSLPTSPSTSTSMPVVVATCSALKQTYRRFLTATIAQMFKGVRIVYVWLDVPPLELEARLRTRSGHYMGAGMLASQLAALEAPILDCGDGDYVLAYQVVRVDCGLGHDGPLTREMVVERVVQAVLQVCPDLQVALSVKT